MAFPKLQLTRSLLMLCFGILTIPFSPGCQSESGEGDTSGDGIVVTDNPTEVISFEEIETFKSGTTMKLRLNRYEYEVKEYSVTLEGTYSMDQRLILLKTPNDLIIGSGDSGSPVLTSDGKIAGALCYGYTDNKHQFAARAIEDVISSADFLEASQSQKLRTVNSGYFKPLEFSYYATLIGDSIFQKLVSGNSAGESNKKQNNYAKTYKTNSKDKIYNNGTIPHVTMDASPDEITTIPGMSILVYQVSGDIYTSGTIGTVSYVTDETISAFGHSYQGTGVSDKPVSIANMITMIDSYPSARKLAVPTNHNIGVLTYDSYRSIQIDRNASASTITTYTSTLFNKESREFSHQVSIEDNSSGYAYLSAALSCPVIYLTDQLDIGGSVVGTLTVTNKDDDQEEFELSSSNNSDISTEFAWDVYYILKYDSSNSITDIKSIAADISIDVSSDTD